MVLNNVVLPEPFGPSISVNLQDVSKYISIAVEFGTTGFIDCIITMAGLVNS